MKKRMKRLPSLCSSVANDAVCMKLSYSLIDFNLNNVNVNNDVIYNVPIT